MSKEKSNPKYTIFFQTSDPIEFSMVVDFLERDKIPYQSVGSLTGAGIGAGQQLVVQQIKVLEEDLEKAEKLLKELTSNAEEIDLPTLSSTTSRANQEHFPSLPEYTHELTKVSPLSLGTWFTLFGFLSVFNTHSTWASLPKKLMFFSVGGFISGVCIGWLYNSLQPFIGGIRYSMIQPSQLLSKEYKENQAFYIDQQEEICGPISTDELVKRTEDGEIRSITKIQVGDFVTRANQIPFLETALFNARRKKK